MADEEMVSVGKERYDQLIAKEAFIILLIKAGVEKWEGFDAVMDYFADKYGEWDLE